MTEIITQAEISRPDQSMVTLAPLSPQTEQIASLARALRNGPTPGALAAEETSGEKPLDEALFDALAVVKILTSQVAMHLDTEWRARLFRQLDALHDAENWEQGDQPIQSASFSSFLKAILALNPQRRPGLGLSHGGNLIAAWTTGRDRLTIEFLPKDRVRWVLSRQHEGNPTRFAGDTPVAELAQGLAAHHPEYWLSNAQKEREFTR